MSHTRLHTAHLTLELVLAWTKSEDYIECESCSEWYHFSCEGLDEDDPPEVYSCKRCRQLAAKGQKVPAQERRRNKAKTNNYMSEMVRPRNGGRCNIIVVMVVFFYLRDNKEGGQRGGGGGME